MLRKYKKLLQTAVLVISSAFAAIVFASTRADVIPPAIGEAPPSVTQLNQGDNGIDKQIQRVRRTLLAPQFRAALSAIGDRIVKPGKERLVLTGMIQRAGETQSVPFVATYQQPGLLRLEAGQGPRAIVFNGQRAEKLGGRLSEAEEAIVELLVCDTPDGFFSGQTGRAATRFLGTRFRADDGTTENYTGPYYDIYRVTDTVKVRGDVVEKQRLFFFNSDTQLIELVRYQTEIGGMTTDVEVRLSNWQKTQDQMFPMRLVQLENNQAVLTLTATSVSFSPEAEDGVFAAN